MIKSPSFKIGIEEEYLLVHLDTYDLIAEVPAGMLSACEALLKNRVAPEFFQSQIEVDTHPCNSIAEARKDLSHLRRAVSTIAAEHNIGLIAASTHPFARLGPQKITEKERYKEIGDDLQAVVRRLMISGMHVHVAVEDDDLRIDLLRQTRYLLPHLLALSTSSPFWEGENTGLMSYRIAVWNEMPRTGLPESFASFSEYQRHVQVLIDAGILEDASKLWWDMRPSCRFPTLEMRIADVCTRLEDTLCIAALYRCWLHMLYRLRQRNQRWRDYRTMLIQENRWRAQRYGVNEGLVDFGQGQLVSFPVLIEDLLARIAQDAEELDCIDEVNHARTIVARGTSAHLQLATYNNARELGAEHIEALREVAKVLLSETLCGLED